MANFAEKLDAHMEDHSYRPETILYVNRVIHVGRVSCETVLELIETLEEDHAKTDAEMAFDHTFSS